MIPADPRCPFLVPVMADRLWIHPVSAYCRRPNGRVKVPGRETIVSLCTTAAHERCPGFLAAMHEAGFTRGGEREPA